MVGKVYARVLNDRVKLMTAEKVMDEQGGFKAGRGCIDQIFAVRQIVEKTIEKDRVVYMAFVDLEKAYDNVNRQKLWNVLEEYGVRGRLLRAVEEDYYEQLRHCTRMERQVCGLEVESPSGLGCTRE